MSKLSFRSWMEEFGDIMQAVNAKRGDWVDFSTNPTAASLGQKDMPMRQNFFDLVDFAYRKYLGEPNVSVASASDVLGSNYTYWEAISIEDYPKADAVLFGKRRFGIKVGGMGHNGKKMARSALVNHLAQKLNQQGYWIEASKPLSDVLLGKGAPVFRDEEKIRQMFAPLPVEQFYGDG